MAKNDSDLFDRLRRAGVRKQVAKTLSEIGEGASKKALRAGHSAVSELRALADEIERRLPGVTGRANVRGRTARSTGSRSRAASRPTSRPRTSRTTPSSTRSASTTSRRAPVARRAAAAPRRSTSPAPRGQNKAKILESLKAGPQTASQISARTGIGASTVSSTLTKMAKAGEISKADRGYRLPN